MKILVSNSQKDLPQLYAFKVRLLLRTLLAFEQAVFEKLNIYFVTEKVSGDLHHTFFGDPSPTDCMTFPIDSKTGEIVICPKIALQYANEHGTNPYEEVSLYLVHGILHLLGYDDLSDDQRKIMREKEERCMEHLRREQALLQSTAI